MLNFFYLNRKHQYGGYGNINLSCFDVHKSIEKINYVIFININYK